jgi:hypothetical protein
VGHDEQPDPEEAGFVPDVLDRHLGLPCMKLKITRLF